MAGSGNTGPGCLSCRETFGRGCTERNQKVIGREKLANGRVPIAVYLCDCGNMKMPNRDLAFLNEYQANIGIKLLLLYLLCYTTMFSSQEKAYINCRIA